MTLNDVIALILCYFTDQSVSAVSGPKFTILSGHVEEVGLLVFSKYFFRLSIHALVAKIAQQRCAMVCRWRFLT